MICKFVSSIGGATEFNLDDSTNYWVLNDSEFPLPEVIYNEVENSLEDGVRVANWRIGGRKITLKLYIKGTSGADLKSKRDALFRQLLKPGILEVRGWDEDASVFYATQPAIPKLPDYWKKYIKDVHRETDITIEIPVEPTVRTALESLTLFENIVPNGDCEEWTGDDLDDWTFTEDGVDAWAGQSALYAYSGDYAVGLTTQNDAVAAMTTTDFIDVLLSHHWQFDCRAAYPPGGTSTVTMSILCYTAADVYIDEIEIVSAVLDGAAADDDWYLHAMKNGATEGVIYPASTGEAVEWPANTAKVKLKIAGTSAGLKGAQIDAIIFGDTEYIAGHKMEAAVTFATDAIVGVLPADMWIYLDQVYTEANYIWLGQSRDYHADKSLVRKPTDGASTVADPNCLGMSYEQYDPPVNEISNYGFESPGGFSEDNTDNFDNWEEYRNCPGASYIGATSATHTGNWALKFYNDGSGDLNGYVLSDKYAVDPAEDYYWEIYTDCDNFAPLIEVMVGFYNGVNFLGSKVLYYGPPTGYMGWYEKVSGHFYSADIPATATHYTLRILGYLGKPRFGNPYYLSIDDVYCGTAGTGGAVEYPLESHEGNYLEMALVSVEATALTDFEIETRSRVVSDALGPISEDVTSSSCDVGNPEAVWACTALCQHTFDRAIIPSSYISEQADKTLLSEKSEIMLPSDLGDRDFYNQAMIRIPQDKAIIRLVNLFEDEHVILCDEGAFRSLDGTLSSASLISPSKVTPPSAPFKADPNGVNLVLVALHDNEWSYEPRPIMNVKLTYSPAYLL